MDEQGSAEWLAKRAQCVCTASEFGDALGIGYTSQHKLLQRKWSGEKQEASWIMLEGNKREPWVRTVLLSLLGRQYDVELPGFALLPGDSRFGGSPDGILVEATTGVPQGLVEIKTRPGRRDTREEIPIMHLVQMCALLQIYGLPCAYYICSTYDVSIQVAKVTFEPQVWQEVYRRLQMFALWHEKKIKPPRMSGDDRENLISLIRRHTLIEDFLNT